MKVLFHQYDAALDLSGKDLISLSGAPLESLEALVGPLVRPEEMTHIEVPAEKVTSAGGGVAEQIHEWPNASMGSSFRKLSVCVTDGRICELTWGFSLSQFLPKKRVSAGWARLLDPRKWF